MKTKYFSVAMVMVVMVAYCQAAMDEMEVDEDEKLQLREKRAGVGKLTKVALRRLARNLRNSSSYASRALRYLSDYFSGSKKYADDIIAVINKVADRMDAFDRATCDWFVDAAASLGQGRSFGHAVCQVVLLLL